MAKEYKKVVVTGGAGFIGSHLVRGLLDKGFEVHVIDNYAGGKFPDRISEKAVYHDGDVTDAKFVLEIVKNAEFVFHLAALPRVQYSIEHPVETNQVNVTGTLVMLKASVDAGVKRFVYSASSSAYGNQEKMPLTEDMAVHPQSPYAVQKYFGEINSRLFSEVYGLETVCLRYFNVYGLHADPNGPYALVIAKFIEQRKKGEAMTIAGDGLNTRDYTHVTDVVQANILAAESLKVGNGEVLNIGFGKNYSVLEIARMVGGEVIHGEPRMEPKHTLSDTTQARTLLGWVPVMTLEKGMEELKKDAGLL
jgi:UDP-glucose 4-epimerase